MTGDRNEGNVGYFGVDSFLGGNIKRNGGFLILLDGDNIFFVNFGGKVDAGGVNNGNFGGGRSDVDAGVWFFDIGNDAFDGGG